MYLVIPFLVLFNLLVSQEKFGMKNSFIDYWGGRGCIIRPPNFWTTKLPLTVTSLRSIFVKSRYSVSVEIDTSQLLFARKKPYAELWTIYVKCISNQLSLYTRGWGRIPVICLLSLEYIVNLYLRERWEISRVDKGPHSPADPNLRPHVLIMS